MGLQFSASFGSGKIKKKSQIFNQKLYVQVITELFVKLKKLLIILEEHIF